MSERARELVVYLRGFASASTRVLVDAAVEAYGDQPLALCNETTQRNRAPSESVTTAKQTRQNIETITRCNKMCQVTSCLKSAMRRIKLVAICTILYCITILNTSPIDVQTNTMR